MVADPNESYCAPQPTLLQPPLADALVVAGEEHVGDRPAAPLGGARVVRVLRGAAQRLAEGLLHGGVGVPERSRQLAQHGVADDHRRQLSPGQHVAPDRDLVGAEVLDDPLVEALVAPAQQRERGLGGQLAGERVVELAPAGRQRDHAALLARVHRVLAVARPQRVLHDVDAQHHPGAAAEGRVVDRAAAQRRRRARVHRVERVPERERVGDVALPPEPVEPPGEQREDVNLHARTSCPRRSGAPSTSSERTASRTSGISSVADLDRLARGQSDHPRDDADLALAVDHPAPDQLVRPELALLQGGGLGDGHAQLGAAQRLGVLARGAALEPEDRARRRCPRGGRSRPGCRRSPARCGPRAARDPRAPRRTSRPARGAGRRSPPGGARYSTMSTRTRRLSLTAAALTTVRSACAVRPPRPMTCP